MIKNYTTDRVLGLFFRSPTRRFHLREICRLIGMGMPSVKLHVSRLEEQGFIRKEKGEIYPYYRADINDKFKLYKRNSMLVNIQESGLMEFLEEEFVPSAVVLFGSASRGEDTENSDIDLLVIAKEKDVNLKKYESALGRKINMIFEDSSKGMPKELLNNVINGIVLYGYLKVIG